MEKIEKKSVSKKLFHYIHQFVTCMFAISMSYCIT